MKIAFLGDSITLGYGLEDFSARFSTLICRKLGCDELNFGITGTLMAQAGLNHTNRKDFVSRLPLISEAEVAVIFGGTNDYFWSDRPINPPEFALNEGKSQSLEFFSNAMEAICTFCQKERTNGKTLFVTPYPHHGIGNYLGGADSMKSSEHDTSELNFNGQTLQDYVDEIEHCAQKAGFPVLNLHRVKGFDWRLHTLDGCHPNPLGHQWLADRILMALAELGIGINVF